MDEKNLKINLFDRLLSIMSESFISFDSAGVILSVNQRFEHLIGSQEQRLIGIPITTFIDIKDHDKVHKALRAAALNGGECSYEIDLIGKDKNVPVLVNQAPIVIPNTKRRSEAKATRGGDRGISLTHRKHQSREGFIWTLTDLTRLKVALSAMEDKQKEIQTSYKELEVTYHKLKEINALKSDFVSMAAHELKTPLTILKVTLENLSIPELNQHQKELMIQTSKKAIDRLIRIIQDHLDVSKIEAGTMDYEIQPHEISETVSYVLHMMARQAEEKGITLKNHVEKGLPMVLVDPHKLIQILMNLVQNAIKFTLKGGEITLSSHVRGDFLEVTVRDTGVGIDPRDHEMIFEKYKQAKNTLMIGQTGGTGLGLPIAKSLIKAQGGDIRVESELEKGSCFIFTIPLAEKKKIAA